MATLSEWGTLLTLTDSPRLQMRVSSVCVCVCLYSCIQIKAADPSPSVTPSSSILSRRLFIDREFQAVPRRAACRWSSCSRPSWFSWALRTPLNSEGLLRSVAVNSICLQGASAVGGWVWACHGVGRVQTKAAAVTNQAPLLNNKSKKDWQWSKGPLIFRRTVEWLSCFYWQASRRCWLVLA